MFWLSPGQGGDRASTDLSDLDPCTIIDEARKGVMDRYIRSRYQKGGTKVHNTSAFKDICRG